MSTYFPGEGKAARKWYGVDAGGQTRGRLAARVARILTGKENAAYTPFLDTGDHVVVINAEKIRVTGLKSEQKMYHHYTGYPGGLRSEQLRKRIIRKPEAVVGGSNFGILRKSKLGRAKALKLKILRSDKHPHAA